MSPIHEIFLHGLSIPEAKGFLEHQGFSLSDETTTVEIVSGPEGELEWVEIYPTRREEGEGAVINTSSDQLANKAELQVVQPVVQRNLRQP